MRGPRQLESIVRAATHHHLQVVPIVPLFGHCSYLLKVERLRYLSELRDASGLPVDSG